ncbi:MAG: hypothetical protein JXB04_02720 [Kiritimatiellae bacterium]|nr:hypothetical protein [Kiritimatiellia bacterium]
MTVPRETRPDLAELFKDWSREDLVQFAAFLLHNYRVMDAFWFLNIENAQGLESACRLNKQVWEKVGRLATRDIKKRFNITADGLPGFIEVLKRYPWNLLSDYRIEERENEIILTVPACPSQLGRQKHGLGEYPCKAMHLAEFRSIAREVDLRIRVECMFAPPDEHPKDVWCKWRFTVKQEEGGSHECDGR